VSVRIADGWEGGPGWGKARPQRDLPVGSARSLLLTVLGALVLPHDEPVWTASLLYVMTGLGLEEQTARQAIARASDAGLIVNEKHGRAVRWVITDSARAEIMEITERAESLINPPERWDGRCLVLAVTVPQQLRTVRKRLYRSLYWQGFGNPAPGLWASPHADRVEELRKAIHDLGLDDHTITFIGNTLGVGLSDAEIVARAWDLEHMAARYEKLIETYQHVEPEPGDDLLLTHLSLLNEYREFPAMDPQLPEDLLPNWVGRRATELFVSLNSRWSAAAHERWLEIVKVTSPST
jgi:phenylacetic acid degradation operon negative regulatory protein